MRFIPGPLLICEPICFDSRSLHGYWCSYCSRNLLLRCLHSFFSLDARTRQVIHFVHLSLREIRIWASSLLTVAKMYCCGSKSDLCSWSTIYNLLWYSHSAYVGIRKPTRPSIQCSHNNLLDTNVDVNKFVVIYLARNVGTRWISIAFWALFNESGGF